MNLNSARVLLDPLTSVLPREQLDQLQAIIKSAVFIAAPIVYLLGLFAVHSFLYDHGIYGTQSLFKASYLITGIILFIIAGLNFALFGVLLWRLFQLIGDTVRVIARKEAEHASPNLWRQRLYQFVVCVGLLALFEKFGPILLDISSGSNVAHATYHSSQVNPFHFFSILCGLATVLVTLLVLITSKLHGTGQNALTVLTRVTAFISVMFIAFSFGQVLYPFLSPLVGGGMPVHARISLKDAKVIPAINQDEIQWIILRSDTRLYLEDVRNNTVVEIPIDQVASIQYYKPSTRPEPSL